jgi:hypothetical protein
MNKWSLFRLLRSHVNLSYKRSPAFDQNRWAKVLMYFGGAFFALYLIIYGTAIGAAADGEAGTIISLMVVILPIDFLLRFIFQSTPAMMVKPYILLPISRYTAIECFLLSSHISGYNFLWLAMFVPYTIIVIAGGASWGASLMVLLSSLLCIILNSQIYLFFRTLVNRNVLWILPGIALYALPYLPFAFDSKGKLFKKMLDTVQEHGTDWWMLPAILFLLAVLFFINRHFQFKYVYEEISKKKEKELKKVSDFKFFNRFGIVGEYLKLELKANIRNKVMRSRTIMSLALVVAFSLLVAYTPVYDNPMMTNFWCLYCFAIYSVTSLIKIMGQEGNYIDLLMVHHESILSILKAKYWFYCVVLIVPFILMLPAVFTGKFTLLMLTAYMLLTAGFIHFVIFQLAVYNKQTLPLQQKITGKGNIENGMQIVIELVALLGPGIIVGVGYLTVGLTATYIFMCVTGLALVLTSSLWLRNIYNRMMQRRYENLEGFHATR